MEEEQIVEGLAEWLWREASNQAGNDHPFSWEQEYEWVRVKWRRYAKAAIAYLGALDQGTSAQDARQTRPGERRRSMKKTSLGPTVAQQDRAMRRLYQRMGIERIENGVAYDKQGRIVGVVSTLPAHRRGTSAQDAHPTRPTATDTGTE